MRPVWLRDSVAEQSPAMHLAVSREETDLSCLLSGVQVTQKFNDITLPKPPVALLSVGQRR